MTFAWIGSPQLLRDRGKGRCGRMNEMTLLNQFREREDRCRGGVDMGMLQGRARHGHGKGGQVQAVQWARVGAGALGMRMDGSAHITTLRKNM